jgi:prophage tail gpP-like protein
VRAGRSARVTYKVDGWEHSAGLWEPNTIVHVTDPQCQLDDDLLLVTATATRSNEEGTHTLLELCDPAAFMPQPLPSTSVSAKVNPYV